MRTIIVKIEAEYLNPLTPNDAKLAIKDYFNTSVVEVVEIPSKKKGDATCRKNRAKRKRKKSK
jgi:hypothetical protein